MKELRILWNKFFQKEDEELGWLLNPYKMQNQTEATMMASFNKNIDDSYQYSYGPVSNTLGREKVTIYKRIIAKKSDTRRRRREEKSLTDQAFDIARYMGMGVYMTSTSFPSPFMPPNDTALYDNAYGPQYSMSKVW